MNCAPSSDQISVLPRLMPFALEHWKCHPAHRFIDDRAACLLTTSCGKAAVARSRLTGDDEYPQGAGTVRASQKVRRHADSTCLRKMVAGAIQPRLSHTPDSTSQSVVSAAVTELSVNRRIMDIPSRAPGNITRK